MIAEACCKLLDMGVVLFDLAPRLSRFPFPGRARFSDLRLPCSFTVLTVSLSLRIRPFGASIRVLISLGTTEHSLQPTWRLGCEIDPIRYWDRGGE